MKFLTEDDLRLEYHQFPFDTFTIKKEYRLTPGARTFLLDRKITIIDERQKLSESQKKATGQKSTLSSSTEEWSLNADWLDLRCSCLQIAFELASFDLSLAQELTSLERCLGTILIGGECHLPPSSKVGSGTETVDKSYILGQLSNVGLFLQTTHGRVLTQLYPLYFQLDKILSKLGLQEHPYLIEVLGRLGQLIAHYLHAREEVGLDASSLIEDL